MGNINYQVLPVSKFKETVVEARLLTPLEPKKATIVSLLSILLPDRTQHYNTKAKMSAKLDELYGAGVSSRCTAYGVREALILRVRAVNEKYAEKGQLLAQVKLLKEILDHPLINEETLKEAKQVLKDNLIRAMDQPRERAMRLAMSLAGKNQALGVSTAGELEDLKSITLEEVITTFEEIKATGDLQFAIIGDVDKSNARSLLRRMFKGTKAVLRPVTYYSFDSEEIKEEIVRDTEQSHIVQLYPCDINAKNHYARAFNLGCIMLGQLPVSLLFTEVREKRSLCYSINSSFISYDGALMINTGIDAKNIDLVLELIEEQIKKIKRGKFDDQLLATAKMMLINSIKSSKDDINSTLNQTYNAYLLDKTDSEEKKIAKIEKVSRREIMSAFAKLKKPVTVVLKGESSHEEE